MLELLSNLTPTEQAAVAGVAVSVVMWVGRIVARGWFADEGNVAKFGKWILSAVLSGFAAIGLCAAQGGCETGQLILSWIICWGMSQLGHNTAKRLRPG